MIVINGRKIPAGFVIAKSGEIYVATIHFGTHANKLYVPGDEFLLLDRTTYAPFGYSGVISNWVIKCKYFAPPARECVWSGIDGMIWSGALTKKGETDGR